MSNTKVRVDAPVRDMITGWQAFWVNLEGPLESHGLPTPKTGPAISMSHAALNLLEELNASAALANNHILDFGIEGLAATLRELDNRGIPYTGASLSGKPGHAPLTNDDPSWVVVNRCEHEWVRDDRGRGAWVFDVIETSRTLQALRSEGARPVVVIHGGNEMFALPSPRRREVARFLAEMGAAAVIYHHTHVLSPMEYWNDVPICYGLGNFATDWPHTHPDWYVGLVAELSASGESAARLSLKVTTFDPTSRVIAMADDRVTRRVESTLDQLAEVVSDDRALEERWDAFVEQSSKYLLKQAVPLGYHWGRYGYAAMSRTLTPALTRNPLSLDPLLNLVRCDSHREVLLAALESRRQTPSADGV